MPDPDKIILPGEEEFPQPPILTPDKVPMLETFRRQDQLRPENGRRPTVVIPVPPYGDATFGVPYPGIVLNRGFVVAMTIRPDQESPDVQAIRIGSGGPNQFNVTFDPSQNVYVQVANSAGQTASIEFPMFRLGTLTRPFRLAAGVRMSDPNRFLCLWADGRLIATAGKGSMPSIPPTFADTNEVSVINSDGVRIISPTIRYYLGDPAPMGGNR